MPFCSLMDPSSSLILRDLFPSPQSPEGKRTLFGNQGRASTGMMCQANSGCRYLNGISYSLVSIFGFNLSALGKVFLFGKRPPPEMAMGQGVMWGEAGWLSPISPLAGVPVSFSFSSVSPPTFLFLFLLPAQVCLFLCSLSLNLSPFLSHPPLSVSVSPLSLFQGVCMWSVFPLSTLVRVCPSCLSSVLHRYPPGSSLVWFFCRTPGLGARRLSFRSWHYHQLAVWLWPSCFTSLGLNFLDPIVGETECSSRSPAILRFYH